MFIMEGREKASQVVKVTGFFTNPYCAEFSALLRIGLDTSIFSVQQITGQARNIPMFDRRHRN
jgi:hypothetical protein